MDNLSPTKDNSEQPVNHNEAGTEYASNQWQRLSPIAIIYFGSSFVQGIIGQFVYIAPGLLLGYNSIKDNPWIGLPIAIGIALLLIVSAVLSFYFFQYRLSKNSIEIRSGVFNKKHVNLPFTRIQNVKIEQPIYYRATGFACLTMDTAGSTKQEAKVVALPLKFAEQLKQEILAKHTESASSVDESCDNKSAPASTNVTSADEIVINTRSIKDLVIHGITSNRIWIFLGIAAPFYGEFSDYVGEFLLAFGVDIAEIFNPATHSFWQLGLYAMSLTMIIMLVLALFSIFGSIMTFYGYTLSRSGDRYIRRSGLFTKHEVTMRLPRLQKIAHKRDWLDMLLKRVNLKFEQSNSQMKNMENGGFSSLSDKIIVPSVTTSEAMDLIRDVYPEHTLDKLTFTKISQRFLIRYIGFLWLPIYIVLSGVLLFNEQFKLLIPLTGIFAFICLLTFMRWKRWGYGLDDNYLYIRKGIFGIDYFVFPRYKVQQTQFKQSKFMKRHELCSVQLVLASGAMNIPFIKQKQGRKIINNCLYDVESSGKSWM